VSAFDMDALAGRCAAQRRLCYLRSLPRSLPHLLHMPRPADPFKRTASYEGGPEAGRLQV